MTTEESRLLQGMKVTLLALIHHLQMTGKLDAEAWDNVLDVVAQDVRQLPAEDGDPLVVKAVTTGFSDIAEAISSFRIDRGEKD